MYNLNSIDEELLGIKDNELKKLDRMCNRANLPPLIWTVVRILHKRLWAYLLFVTIISTSLIVGILVSYQLTPQVKVYHPLTTEDMIYILLGTLLICLLGFMAELICELFIFQPATFFYKLFKKN